MFLFLKLLLAHLTADFLLQAGPVYAAKKKGFPGTTIHYLIVFFSYLVFSLPYLTFAGCWVVIIIATIGHTALDEIKLRAITSRKNELIVFAADQVLHVAFLLPVFLFRFAYSAPRLSGAATGIYASNTLTVSAIGYLTSAFAGVHVWGAIKNSFFEDAEINPVSRNYGIVERAIITTATLSLYLLGLLLIPLLVRAVSRKIKFTPDFIFNLAYSAMIGLLLGYASLY